MAAPAADSSSSQPQMPITGDGWVRHRMREEGKYKPFISDKVDDIACYVLIGVGAAMLVTPLVGKFIVPIFNHSFSWTSSTALAATAVVLPVGGVALMAVGGLQWAGVFNDRARLEYEMKREEEEEAAKKAAEEQEKKEREEALALPPLTSLPVI